MRRRIALAGMLVCGPVQSKPIKPSSVKLMTLDQAQSCSPLGMMSKSLTALEYGNKHMQAGKASLLKRAERAGANAGVMRTTAHINLYTMVLRLYQCADQPAVLQSID
ncbi:hypothetical protein [Sphingomonas crusticola]|uniref:hypothetical protein n=1 Tax=Sphingomonas crusticola TaxID=1697973 RepID=UPI0013C359D5|nr:hypothetical protein [Sphingomonas crusticola]